MTLDILMFYISEYFLYTVIMLVVLFLGFYFRKNADYEDRKYIAIVIFIFFFAMFGGLGSYIKPYFTATGDMSLVYNGVRYNMRGSGVFVNPSDVITNKHVVDGCESNLAVRSRDGKVYAGRLISTLPIDEGDLAFIRTGARREAHAIMSNSDPKVGDVLIFPNYTNEAGVFDVAKALTKEIYNLNDPDKPYYYEKESILITLAPKGRKGNSGSPIYNKKGYMVGVNHSGGGIFTFTSNPMMSAPLYAVTNFARNSGVDLYYLRSNEKDLTELDYFEDNFAVNVMCGRKIR